jgi:malonate-semialdehyde dehydrogenase (acetylating)/methylmalonate-semialdehyde dehydrogenase
MIGQETLMNFVGGRWEAPGTTQTIPVTNPATGDQLADVPLSSAADVGKAVQSASSALVSWRRTPPGDRIQPLFRLKALLDANFGEIARLVTQECGKTLAESEGELRRGIENVEVATGIPSLMMGSNLEDIASGIDELMIRQPVGVVGVITPFNFPGMIPLWFLPYAVACGNTLVLKPSEKTPLTMARVLSSSNRPVFPLASSTWYTVARTLWTRCSITPRSERSPSWARRPWRGTSTAGPRPTASACSVRAEPRTPSSCCQTPTWT